jgi:hypothetical protein
MCRRELSKLARIKFHMELFDACWVDIWNVAKELRSSHIAIHDRMWMLVRMWRRRLMWMWRQIQMGMRMEPMTRTVTVPRVSGSVEWLFERQSGWPLSRL